MQKAYPSHQVGPRMEEFAAIWMATHADMLPENFVYVPVFWDNYWVTHKFGREGRKELQKYCDYLGMQYRGKRLFTVVEYADGIMTDCPNMTTFACAGKGKIPIPLLCDRHPNNHQKAPKYYATFVGSLKTHPVREQMAQFKDREGWYIAPSQSVDQFRFLMDNSRYALCPRGYGPTSYRIFEAIQMGCIPVYVGDDFWLPYQDWMGFDWSEFCVLVKTEDVASLPEILDTEDAFYDGRMKRLHEVQEMFTHDYAMRYVIERMERE